MTIERTDLANTDFNARVNAKVALAELGARMARASVEGDTETVDIIKDYWRTRQTWRNQ